MGQLIFLMPAAWLVIAAALPLPAAATPLDERAGGRLILAQAAPELSGEPGQSIDLGLPEATPGQQNARFMLIRGVPQGFLLSQGFRVKESWFLSVTEAKGLRITSPADFAGELTLEVQYFKDSGAPPLSSLTRTVAIRARSNTQQTAAQPDQPPAPALSALQGSVSRKPPLSPEREAQTLLRAEGMMKRGDVAGARLLFEDLAAMGSAKGAYAMAQSYDPDHLRRFFIQGIQPDVERARTWYEKAAGLGDGNAQSALSALQQHSGSR